MQPSSSEGSVNVRPSWEGYAPGLRARLVISIVAPVAWLSFTLLYVGFWATGFTVFQSVVVLLVSALILAGVMGGLWTWWGPRYRHTWEDS